MDTPSFSFLKPPMGRRLRLIMLFFALLFSLSAIAQYLFIKYQLDRARTTQAKTWAAEIDKEIAYTTKWNLKEFRQADWEAPSAFIFATNGVLVDVEGFIPGLTPTVAVPDGLDYEHPKDYVSEIGETWRLLAKRIQGGTVVLGISYVYNMAVDDEKLLADAKKFGTTIAKYKITLAFEGGAWVLKTVQRQLVWEGGSGSWKGIMPSDDAASSASLRVVKHALGL